MCYIQQVTVCSYFACSHMTGGEPQLANLPEDLPPAQGLKTCLIQPGDYRKGLTPNKDLAVHATQPFPADSVLGVYRCIAFTKSEKSSMKHSTPEGYTGCNAKWRQALDMYAAEIAPPVSRTCCKHLLQEVFDGALQVSHAAYWISHDALLNLCHCIVPISRRLTQCFV